MSKKVLLLLAHPSPESFARAWLESYAQGLERAGHTPVWLPLSELNFALELEGGKWGQPLEPELVRAQALLKECSHWVLIYPIWWGSLPARFKGFLDRILTPGFAFKYQAGERSPQRLLTGRSAEVIALSDEPPHWIDRCVGEPSLRALKNSVLKFCGISPVQLTHLYSIRKSTPEQRKHWLMQAQERGARLR